jgi:hypothetical protein
MRRTLLAGICSLAVCFLGAPMVIGAFAQITVGGGSAGRNPHHCDSDELQNKSCTAPGNCWNACAFYCDSAQKCSQCCSAFLGGAKDNCNDECDSIPWEQ